MAAITIEGPLEGHATNENEPTFSGHTEDTVDPVTVAIFKGTSAVGEPVQALVEPFGPLGGAWTLRPESALPDGIYTAIAEQTELSGPSKSPSLTFTVDTTPPSVSLDAVTSPTNDATPTLEGSAGTAPGDVAAVSVTIYENGSPKAIVAASVSGGEWSSTLPQLPDGTYTAQATQHDGAGNVGSSSIVEFTIDTTPPSVSLDAVPSPTSDATPTLEGSAGTEPGDESTVHLIIHQGASTKATATASVSGGGWSSTLPQLPDGTYTAQATQHDEAGNVGSSSIVEFTIDTTLPAVTLNAQPPYIDTATPSFSGSAGTAAGDVASVELRIYTGSAISGTALRTAVVTPSAGTWATGPIEALPDGTYTAVAEQSNDVPKTARSASSTFAVDTIPPQVVLGFPTEGTSTNGSSQLASGSASLAPGDLRTITVRLYAGSATGEATPSETHTVEANAVNGSWSTTFAGLAEGTYTVRAEQRDRAGNHSLSAARAFSVISAPETKTVASPTPPAPPTASFTWVPSTPHTGERVSLISSSTDASEPISSFAWDLAGNGPFAASGPVLNTSFSSPGGHVVRLRVTGADGSASIATQTIQVSPPALILMQPFPIVRIVGSETSFGVNISLLTVLAPLAARVTVTCRGVGCRTKFESHIASAGSKSANASSVLLSFPHFDRALRAGVVLEIRVSKPGEIGKYTRFRIRRHRVPARLDSCLGPIEPNPIACPS
jgi:uncharacterized protein (DUF2141 family)